MAQKIESMIAWWLGSFTHLVVGWLAVWFVLWAAGAIFLGSSAELVMLTMIWPVGPFMLGAFVWVAYFALGCMFRYE